MATPVSYPAGAGAGRARWRVGLTQWPAVATGAAVVLAIAVRTFLVLSRGFPLNDGALFYLMSQEISEHAFRLPAWTAYNAANIPFAYSPLGFYLAAFLHTVTGAGLVELLRALPLVFSCLCVVAFYLLARDLIPTRATIIAALATFAVLPRSFLWLIMGGGLTRSIGFFFAILTLWQLHRAYTRPGWRHVAWTTVFASLTVLSHLGTAPFVAFSAALMLLCLEPGWPNVRKSVAIAIGTVVLTSPWWATVAAAHGFAPFLAAGATGGTVFGTHRGEALTKLAFFGLGTAEPLFPIIGALAILGAFSTLTRRGAFLPLWWLTIILLDTRAGATYASIPVALLAGLAITEVIVPIVARPPLWGGPAAPGVTRTSGWETVLGAPRARQWAVGVVLVVLVGYGIASSVVRGASFGAEGRFLTSLTRDDRQAMAWVARQTPRGSRFLIMVGGAAGGWWADRVGEWFPVLTKRVSVATVQGTEWLPSGTFENRERQYDRLQGCAFWGAACIEDWARETAMPYSYVYIPKTLAFACCGPLDSALRHDPSYRLVFDGPGATIYEVKEPALW